MKCNTCGEHIRANCDYKQGRCPHAPPLIDMGKFRIYNVIQKVKGWFK